MTLEDGQPSQGHADDARSLRSPDAAAEAAGPAAGAPLHGTPGAPLQPSASAAPVQNLAAVEDFCSRLDILPYDPRASLHYGQIRALLEGKGIPIGVNDLHIAAHARCQVSPW